MYNNAFFLGKGGVGKTTLSSAFGLEIARRGKRVLVASLDPAHNLGDVYGTNLAGKPKKIEANLDALEIDLGFWIKQYLDNSREELKTHYAYASTMNLDPFFDIMRYSPGTEEYAVLWAIEHIHCDLAPDYDLVVFDTPPTALTLRFLAMPTITNMWIQELSNLRAHILERRQTIGRLNPDSPVAESCVDKDDDKVYGRLGNIGRRLMLLKTLFTQKSFISVIVNPDILSVSEALRIKDEMGRLGLPLSAVLVNKLGMGTNSWNLDSDLFGQLSFDVAFKKEGLRSIKDLGSIDIQNLANHFLESWKES